MRTLESDSGSVELVLDLVRPSDSNGVLAAGCLDVQNEVSVPRRADGGVPRDCLVRPCSRSDAVDLPPAGERGGVAVISVLFLTLFVKDGGEGSIVKCVDRVREGERVLSDGKYLLGDVAVV